MIDMTAVGIGVSVVLAISASMAARVGCHFVGEMPGLPSLRWKPCVCSLRCFGWCCNDFSVVMILLRSLEICMPYGGSQLLNVDMRVWLTNYFCIKREGKKIPLNKVCIQDRKYG